MVYTEGVHVFFSFYFMIFRGGGALILIWGIFLFFRDDYVFGYGIDMSSGIHCECHDFNSAMQYELLDT